MTTTDPGEESCSNEKILDQEGNTLYLSLNIYCNLTITNISFAEETEPPTLLSIYILMFSSLKRAIANCKTECTTTALDKNL